VTAPPAADVRTVRLLNLPVRVASRAREHHEELMREFALLELSDSDAPSRLMDLVANLESQYAAETEGPRLRLEEALSRGQRSIDLEYQVPAVAGDAVVALGAMLEEADEYCRQGEQLLTLASPPELVAYRQWYLDEFVRQIAGEPPRPWDGPLD
jgi:hypothetical protein